MKSTLAVLLASAIVVVGLITMLSTSNSKRYTPSGSDPSNESALQPLMLYCAASNREPIARICAQYTEQYGREIEIQFGPSQALLSAMEISGRGDLFLPADDSYITMAQDKGLVEEVFPLANMNVVIGVKKGNPKNIKSLDDLLRSDVRLVQADPQSAAIGKVVRSTLQSTGKWEGVEKATTAFRPTIADAANDLVIGAADAAFSYDAFLCGYENLEAVQINDFDQASSLVAVSINRSTKDPRGAIHFARYLSAQDRGLQVYRDLGFDVVQGDDWSETPELTLFAGSMLRPAIEETIIKFEEREGVTVNRVYNGCGILVAQMQAGQVPDAYFACDKEFMNMVPELFPQSVDVSQNELVILVQKGNPHQIASLKDLSKGDLKVGLGHEKQCAMGWLTQNTLKEDGVQQEVMKNVTVQAPTGDMLVNQMLTGSLDAAVVYLSNAAGAGEKLDAIRITGLPCAIATQPYGIRAGSKNSRTADRLFAALNRPEAQESFTAEGFRLMSTPLGEQAAASDSSR